MGKLRIGVLLSGRGSNFIAIADACDRGDIDGEIVAVGSDNPEAVGIEKAKERNLYTFTADYKTSKKIWEESKSIDTSELLPQDFNYFAVFEQQSIFPPSERHMKKTLVFFFSRAMAEKVILDEFRVKGVELVVLAGFEKLVTTYFINGINTDGIDRIMNIHPALLPAFPGTDGYGDTLKYGCKVGGCTVHFVDSGKDTGPIIDQMPYYIDPGDTLDSIKEKGLKNEWILYPRCIQLFAEGRLRVSEREGRRVVDKLTGKVSNIP